MKSASQKIRAERIALKLTQEQFLKFLDSFEFNEQKERAVNNKKDDFMMF